MTISKYLSKNGANNDWKVQVARGGVDAPTKVMFEGSVEEAQSFKNNLLGAKLFMNDFDYKNKVVRLTYKYNVNLNIY